MDETAKVLVATISGFIIAFFAEPVKNYYQNLRDVERLRLAIYRELVSNYLLFDSVREASNEDLSFNTERMKHAIRTECYKDALANRVLLYYQFRNTLIINMLYALLSEFDARLNSTQTRKDPDLGGTARQFYRMFEGSAYDKTLERGPLETIFGNARYQAIVAKGKKVYLEDNQI
jgi:hypothetical protein